MNLEDYFADFNSAVAATAQAESNFTFGAFLDVVAERLAEAQEVSDLIPEHFSGVGSNNRTIRLDGLVVDEADGSLVVLIGEHRLGAELTRLTTSDAQRLFRAVEAFVEDAVSGRLGDVLEESSEAFRTATQLKRLLPTTSRLRIYLATNAQMSDRIKDFPPSRLGSAVVSYHIWDIARFHQASLAANGREDIVIDLTEWAPDGIPALSGGSDGEGFQTFLAVIPGQVLAEIYLRYGSRLLEGNVRSFLTTRVKVNRGMRGTLAQTPHLFLAYNNGLTCTAAYVETVQGSPNRIGKLGDLQIVNGGQTTASIANYLREVGGSCLDGVFVQMKLVVVDTAEYETLVPNVAKFANTQNSVSEADFFSNSPYHLRLEDLSRRLLAPPALGSQVPTYWFYERARGQYANEKSRRTLSDRRKFEAQNPRSQVIVKTDVAKYLLSWGQRPHDVSLGAQKAFTKFAQEATSLWESRPDDVNEHYYRDLVAKAVLFSAVRKRISAQPWYETGGYLANLTTYTVAKLSQTVGATKATLALDFGKIWADQSVSAALLEGVDVISTAVQSVLTSSKRGSQNVSEWAKKPECWDQVVALPVELPNGLLGELVSTSTVRAERTTARTTQRLDTGIEAQMKVLAVSRDSWIQIRDSPESRTVLSPQDFQALKLVTGEIARAIPEGVQVQRLLTVLRKAQEYGIVPES
jgi:hypothetical protein